MTRLLSCPANFRLRVFCAVFSENPIRRGIGFVCQNRRILSAMTAILRALVWFFGDLFKVAPPAQSRESAASGSAQYRSASGKTSAPERRSSCSHIADRAVAWPYLGLFGSCSRRRSCAGHRAGFRMFWRWKSRRREGRQRIDRGVREMIRRISRKTPLWGASRIDGELRCSNARSPPNRPSRNIWCAGADCRHRRLGRPFFAITRTR